jgi:thiol-disulfide isomerase/thioredoxin
MARMKRLLAPALLLLAACHSNPPAAPTKTAAEPAAQVTPAPAPAAVAAPAVVAEPVAVAAPVGASAQAGSVPGAPGQGVALSAAKPKEKPVVYDESADGRKQIADALAKAKFAHKRVLIQWGANWCGWCIKLHELERADKEIARELLYEYEPIVIDIGQWNKHLDLGAKYDADIKAHGVPYLTVLDEDGKVVVNQDSSELEVPKSDHHDPAKVLGFLKANQAPQSDAEALLAAALARARTEEKRVLVHFSTPWCGWCRRFEAWMAQPAVAQLMEKDYVDILLDAERYAGTTDVLKRYTQKVVGWPWFVLLDADGKSLAESFDEKGANIGCPWKDEEIAVFVAMLDKTRTRLQPADLETLRRSLAENRERVEAVQKQKAAP